MNENHAPTTWQVYLRQLPTAEPSAALRARVLAQPGRARWRPGALLGTAAAALAVLALGMGMLSQPGHPPAADALLPTAAGAGAGTLAAAQALEHRVRQRGIAAGPGLRAGIADIDRALQDAYRRHAHEEELDALWRARTVALDAMDKGLATAPIVPARI